MIYGAVCERRGFSSKQVLCLRQGEKNGYFEADLTNFTPGEYEFTVKVKGESYSETGVFTISNFDLEKQCLLKDTVDFQIYIENKKTFQIFEYLKKF